MPGPAEAPHRANMTNKKHDHHPLSSMTTAQVDPSAIFSTPRVRRFSAKLVNAVKKSPRSSRVRSISPPAEALPTSNAAHGPLFPSYHDRESLSPCPDAQHSRLIFPSITPIPVHTPAQPETRYSLRPRSSQKRSSQPPSLRRHGSSSPSPSPSRGTSTLTKAKRRRLNCPAASDQGAEIRSPPRSSRRAHVVLGVSNGVKQTSRLRKDLVAERLCKLTRHCDDLLDLSQHSLLPGPPRPSPSTIIIDHDNTPDQAMASAETIFESSTPSIEPSSPRQSLELDAFMSPATPMDTTELSTTMGHCGGRPSHELQHVSLVVNKDYVDNGLLSKDDEALELGSYGVPSSDDESDDSSSIKLAQTDPTLKLSYLSKVVGHVSRYILG